MKKALKVRPCGDDRQWLFEWGWRTSDMDRDGLLITVGDHGASVLTAEDARRLAELILAGLEAEAGK